MKRTFITLAFGFCLLAAMGQTMNVRVGGVTYQFPSAQTGDMTYANGTTLTIMGKTFTLSEVDEMTVDDTEVSANHVDVAYNGFGTDGYVRNGFGDQHSLFLTGSWSNDKTLLS